MSRALVYLEELSKDRAVKVTLTHLVGKALADAIARRPEVNAVITNHLRSTLQAPDAAFR